MRKELTGVLLMDLITPYADILMEFYPENIDGKRINPNTINYDVYLMDLDYELDRVKEIDDTNKRANIRDNIKRYKLRFSKKVNELLELCLRYKDNSSLTEDELNIISEIVNTAMGENCKVRSKDDLVTLARYNSCRDETILYCKLNGMTKEEANVKDPYTLIMDYLGIKEEQQQQFVNLLDKTSIDYFRFATSLIEFEHEKMYIERNMAYIKELLDNDQRYLYRAGNLDEDGAIHSKNPDSNLTELDHILCGSRGENWDTSFVSTTESFPVMASYLYVTKNGGKDQCTDQRTKTMAIDLKKLYSMLEQIKKKQELVGKAIGEPGKDDGYTLCGEFEYLTRLSELIKQHGEIEIPETLARKLEEVEAFDDISYYKLYETDESLPTEMICYGNMRDEEIYKRRAAIVNSDRGVRVSQSSKNRFTRKKNQTKKRGQKSEIDNLNQVLRKFKVICRNTI